MFNVSSSALSGNIEVIDERLHEIFASADALSIELLPQQRSSRVQFEVVLVAEAENENLIVCGVAPHHFG